MKLPVPAANGWGIKNQIQVKVNPINSPIKCLYKMGTIGKIKRVIENLSFSFLNRFLKPGNQILNYKATPIPMSGV